MGPESNRRQIVQTLLMEHCFACTSLRSYITFSSQSVLPLHHPSMIPVTVQPEKSTSNYLNGKGDTITLGSIYTTLGSPVLGSIIITQVPSAEAGLNKPFGSA